MNPIATYPELAPAAMSLQVEELESLEAATEEEADAYVAGILVGITIGVLIGIT